MIPLPPLPEFGRARASTEHKLNRRQLLFRGAIATGAIVVAGFAIRLADLFNQPPAKHRKVLSEREVLILTAIVEAIFPGGDMPPGDPELINNYVDQWLSQSTRDLRLFFKSMMHVVEDQALLLTGTRFSQHSLAKRMELVREWERTKTLLRKKAFTGVKFTIALGYMEQPKVAKAMGWYVGCSPQHLMESGRTKTQGRS